jgi:hypothetical protein
MGGLGSGNRYHWWRSSKKIVVEHCRHLDANRWMREGILSGGICQTGTWAWFRDEACKVETSSIGYEVDTATNPPWIRLLYTLTSSGTVLDYRVGLTTTVPRFGGLRWWFLCPLLLRGRLCARRVGKLYLHRGYYGCWHCHNLTYTSCQEHDGRMSARLRNPQALEALLDNQEEGNGRSGFRNPLRLIKALAAALEQSRRLSRRGLL